MPTKTKAFDCVAMKNRIQDQRMAEYAAQKDKYVSFTDFVRARASKSEWVQEMRKRLGTDVRH